MIAIVILALAGLAFVIWFFINADERRGGSKPAPKDPTTLPSYYRPEDPVPDTGSTLINHMGTPPAPKPAPVTEAPSDRTLDELYAASHNLWICGYCETMNLNGSRRCSACGHGKNE